jgi:diguanylate cyclase (GGDEF)-like protein
MKIEVVDDTRTNLLIVCKHIELLGHTAVTAANGAKAIEVYKRERPDLILLDVIMPEMDGFEAAQQIRALEINGSWTPIIFLTGMNGDEDLKRGIEAGGDDYLIKPVSPVVLAAKIKAMQRLHDMRNTLVETARQLDSANRQLQRLSTLDGLTGIANRRRFDEAMEIEWRRNARAATALSLIMIDVDFFKPYNDHYGHLMGDDSLRKVAGAMHQVLKRPGDLLARYGGEEFVAILPSTPLSGGMLIAQQMRDAVSGLSIPHGASTAANVLTISVGLACGVPEHGTAPDKLTALADEMLYKAKQCGRNQVQFACFDSIDERSRTVAATAKPECEKPMMLS